MKNFALILATGALMAFLAVIPYISTNYVITLMLVMYMYMVLSGSWNIISGYTGYISFGHVAFFGIGAYTCGILVTRFSMHWLLASILGGFVAAIIAAPIGYLTLRLRGPYFLIATLGFSEIIKIIALAWDSLTGGGSGLSLPPIQNFGPFYHWMGITALAVVALTYYIDRSKFGYRLMAIREDEIAAEVIGINTTLYKLAAFLLSSFFPGIAGGIYAIYLSYLDPPTVFSILITIQMVIMTIFGGAGTVIGPIIGTAALYLIAEWIWIKFPFIHLAIYGLLIAVVVLFMPGGLIGLLKEKRIAISGGAS